jgi:Zn-dependent protease
MSEAGFLPVPESSAAQPEAPATGPFAEAALEAAYQFDREMLLKPAPVSGKGLLLIGTLALFILMQVGSGHTAFDIGALVAVLLLHESGHFAGMKLFGYRDVKMFFIPLLGAAVSGRKRGVAGWKEATVLLLGPLPGLIAGVFLIRYLHVYPDPRWRSVAASLIAINAFNLLPIAPLDGGQFFRLLIFSRNRFLELVFGAVAGGVLIVWGLSSSNFFLPVIGLLMMLALPALNRILRAAKELRAKYGILPADPAQLEDAQARDLFLAAHRLNANVVRRRPRDGAAAMELILERTVSRPPSVTASAVLLVPWLAGVVAALLGLYALSTTPALDWQVHEVPQGGFVIKMPQRASLTGIKGDTPLGSTEMLGLDAMGSGGMFDVRWYDLPMPALIEDERAAKEFLDWSRDLIMARIDAKLVDEGVPPDGARGRMFRMSSEKYGFELARVLLVGSRVFILLAPAEPAAEATEFFDSFKGDSATARAR